MKKWFSNCFPLLYICLHCDVVRVCWHICGAPGTPGFYVRAQHDPEKICHIDACYIMLYLVLIGHLS